MSSRFVIRFAAVLFVLLVLFTLMIEFSTSGDTTVIMWIFAVPFILGIPIFTSIVLAKNDEMEIPSNQ